MPSEHWGTIISTIISLIGSIIAAYFFTLGKITYESMTWIIIALIFVIIIIAYQDIRKEFNNQGWEIKRINEKLKIYERLNLIEEKLKYGSQK